MPKAPLFDRYAGNPILNREMWPHTVNAVFNPAAVSYQGRTLLLVRVEDRCGLSHLVIARSTDGYTDWEVSAEPALSLDPDCYEEATWWDWHRSPS